MTVAVDDKPVYNKEFNGGCSVDLDDLGINDPDVYDILVSFIPKTGSTLTLADYTFIVTEEEEDIGIYCNIRESVDISDPYSSFISYTNNNDQLNGNIVILIDGDVYYDEEIQTDAEIYLGDLDYYPPAGICLVQLTYSDDGENLTLISSELTMFDYRIGIEDFEYGEYVLPIGPDAFLDVFLPHDATGSLYVVLNGKEYKVAYKDGQGNVTLPTRNLDLNKEYDVSVVLRNDQKYPEINATYEVTTVPSYDCPYYMSVGEKDMVTVELPSKYSGTLKLYNAKEDEGIYVKDGNPIGTANVVNGKASIKFSQSKVGMFHYIVEYVSGNYNDSVVFDVEVINNANGIAATVEPTTISAGDSVTIKITGPKDLNENFYIYVDGVVQDKPLNFFNLGSVSKSVKLTTVGEHAIKVLAGGVYSNTFYVTVKQAPAKKADKITLSLKKVKVKKSAKKLVIQATLKINGKKVKGKVIKFKFNKKSYKAKTNKKGVAKITIKKNVLKKLKVGKKVTYQATYNKVTKKVTVKVKK